MLMIIGRAKQRQFNLHLSSLSLITPDLNRPPVRLHDLFALVESDAKPTGPIGLQWSKQCLKHDRRDAGSRIVNRDDDGTIESPGRN
jgi:hypothetical protein